MSIKFCLDCGERTVERELRPWENKRKTEKVDLCPECGRIYRRGKQHEPLPLTQPYWEDDDRPDLEIVP